jgi:erythromycin esterase-like protein
MITDRSQFLYNEADALADQVKKVAHPLESEADLDPLLDSIGQARYVLLGAGSYGASEYYTWRARLTRRLIREKGFSLIAVEGDWSDCYEINRYIKGYPDAGENAVKVLNSLDRWPSWSWANWEMVAPLEWLRQHNDTSTDKVGFYGLDRYNLWETMNLITGYLEQTDLEAAEAARWAWVCFEPFARDAQADSGDMTLVPQALRDEVLRLLAQRYYHNTSARLVPELPLEDQQNGLNEENAEQYYRTLTWGNVTSWNIRAHHLVDTLDRLVTYHGSETKTIIWAHNSHIADARATDMVEFGRVNLGQLVREWHGQEDVVLLGSGSYRANIIAAQNWGAPPELMPVPQAVEGSWGDVLHQAVPGHKFLLLKDAHHAEPFLERRGHRAIGVVYNSARERFSNYIPVVLPHAYDAFLYIDETQALHPLHLPSETEPKQRAMYPWGL